jgi:hypothetical protein
MKSIIVIIEKVVSLLSGVFIFIKERLLINEVKRQRETNEVEDKATDVKLKEKNIEELNKELGYIASTATKKRITKNVNIKQAQPKKTTKKTTKRK